ncbi:hypothetical protein FACS1894199_19390 [Bacteroidia bacterium]|nr:hypothetical protein FACS1894199_19390 [Bacteroidia bacterium]
MRRQEKKTMSRYLDPKNDLIFKRIFGEHKELCISLLNSLLPLEHPIISIEYQTGELLPEIPFLKDSIVDVRCEDDRGRQFIVEMQMLWTNSFQSRVLLNASKAYIKQLDAGEDYDFLQPVYSLNFVNQTYQFDTPGYYHHYQIVNIHDTEKQIQGLEFIFVELQKFKAQSMSEKKLQVLWLRFLTEVDGGVDSVSADFKVDKNICKAIKYTERAAYKVEDLYTYDRVRDVIMTKRAFISDAKKEGKAEGRTEKEIEVVLNSHRVGIPLKKIAQISGLTIDQVKMILEK